MVDTNLIPAPRLTRKRRRIKVRLWTTACGTYTGLIVLASLAVYVGGRADGTAAVGDLLAAQRTVRERDVEVRQMREQLDQATAILETAETLKHEPDWSKFLILLGGELGDEIVLSQLELLVVAEEPDKHDKPPAEVPVRWPLCVSAADKEYRIRLTGFGRTQYAVSAFTLRLETLELFDSVRLDSSSRKAFLNETAVGFHLECCIR